MDECADDADDVDDDDGRRVSPEHVTERYMKKGLEMVAKHVERSSQIMFMDPHQVPADLLMMMMMMMMMLYASRYN